MNHMNRARMHGYRLSYRRNGVYEHDKPTRAYCDHVAFVQRYPATGAKLHVVESDVMRRQVLSPSRAMSVQLHPNMLPGQLVRAWHVHRECAFRGPAGAHLSLDVHASRGCTLDSTLGDQAEQIEYTQ